MKIRVKDYRLGLLYYSLTAAAVTIACILIFGGYGFYRQEAESIDASKAISFWFEGANDMASVARTSNYCINMNNWDYAYYADDIDTYDARFYDESNNMCRSYGFGSVAKKISDTAFITR